MIQKLTLILFLSLSYKVVIIAQTCDATQQLTPTQEINVKVLLNQLDGKLRLEDQFAIDSLQLLIKKELGLQQGLPATEEKYTILESNTELLSLSSAIDLSRKLIDKDISVYKELWKTAKGIKPKTALPNSIFLRTSAEYAMGLMLIADKETDIRRKNDYTSWATQTLDSLLTMQLSSGAFPFPDLRIYNDPIFTPILNNFITSCGKDSVNVLVNGWIVDDKNTGEFKFDAGVITHAFYCAYLYTKAVKYKEAVIRLADYLLNLPLNVNYNYNTFVALGLANGYALTNNITYLIRGIQNLKLGVFPGQSTNGKWIDGHNASARYHNIIIQNCAELLSHLEKNEQEELNSVLCKAVRNQLNSTYTCGSSTGFRWLLNNAFHAINKTNKNLTDSTLSILGRYIQTANNNGNYLDIPTMGEYLHFIENTLSLEENRMSSLKVTPNPAQNRIQINTEKEIESLSITDYYGRIVLNINQIETNTIDLGELPNGTYQVIYEIDQKYYYHKMIIIK